MGSAFEVPLHKPPCGLAAADLSAKHHYLVKMTSTGVNLCGDGEAAIGVLQNKPASGVVAEVETLGTTMCVAGDAITQGANVASDTNGKAVTAASGDFIVGTALTAAGADLEEFTLLLRPQGRAA